MTEITKLHFDHLLILYSLIYDNWIVYLIINLIISICIIIIRNYLLNYLSKILMFES
jgi:hypothetical protein